MKHLSGRSRVLFTLVLSGFLHACGGGGGPANTSSTNIAEAVVLTALASGDAVSLPIANGGTIAIDQSLAQVQMPANALVDAETGAPVTGTATVTLTVLDPATNPSAMSAGSYEAINPTNGQTGLIESFGAISVNLSQNDKRLQLAKGQTATIRIPLSTRSGERPSTIPLYYWDETKAYWIEEGSATLKGDASSGYYYEAKVSHFTAWNADKPIDQSVTVSGCVKDSKGQFVAINSYFLQSRGTDYSGMALASQNGDGKFNVLMKKGGTADLLISYQDQELVYPIGKISADTTLSECLVIAQYDPNARSQAQSFATLFDAVMNSVGLAMSPTAAIDDAADTPIMLAPAAVCQSGKLNKLTLNGQNVVGGELLREATNQTIAINFNNCAQDPTQQSVISTGSFTSGGTSDLASNWSGSATAILNGKTAGPDTFNGIMTSTLTDLQDSTSNVGSTGTYTISTSSTASNDSISITPSKGTTVTNLLTKGLLVFKDGKLLSSTQTDTNGASTSSVFQFDQLRYTIGANDYVLSGQLGSSGNRFTLLKNGQVSAVISLGAFGWIVTGQVDAF